MALNGYFIGEQAVGGESLEHKSKFEELDVADYNIRMNFEQIRGETV
jgi:hypothetical protein